jgi:hypothetical protein
MGKRALGKRRTRKKRGDEHLAEKEMAPEQADNSEPPPGPGLTDEVLA